ncbi:MAG TPA: hypothetical protein PLM24_07530 [Methanothrix sp.]|nr:hypothetical protein [Methanothrix sp.]HPR66966.1 hypothetical protein [Methanothrix sp.]
MDQKVVAVVVLVRKGISPPADIGKRKQCGESAAAASFFPRPKLSSISI